MAPYILVIVYDFSEENVASISRIKPQRRGHYVLQEKLFATPLFVVGYKRFGNDKLLPSAGWKKL
jgi:hypothetical protein